ncbi:MAG: hypothetical protein L3J07_00495 [Candidatus Magasanikbacteria bacterium]|nr:hypothetical protein [Candidatus Magasanikbacteria bacterium]
MYSRPVKILIKRYKLLLTAGIIGTAIVLTISLLVSPLEYRADAQVLIISQSRLGVDPYTVVKSAERIGENLIQIMKTEDFLNKVIEQDIEVFNELNLQELDTREKRKLWNKSTSASVVYGTGVLNVSAFHQNSEIAEKLSKAVVDTLVFKGWEYVGGDVVIKVINNPVATKFPVRPNLPLNAFAGFVFGTIFMGLILVRKFR